MLESDGRESHNVLEAFKDGALRHNKEFSRHAMAELPGYTRDWDGYVFEGIVERERAGYPEEKLWSIIHGRAARLSDIVRHKGQHAALRHAELQLERMRSITRRVAGQENH